MYGRVLKAVFKTAWRDSHFALDCSDSPLREARGYRDAMGWQIWNAITSKTKRRKLGIAHGTAGQQQSGWEHLFVALWEIGWQRRMSDCTSEKQWMRNFRAFADGLCDLWRLLRLWIESDREVFFFLKTHKLPTTIEDIPPMLPNLREEQWDSQAGRLWVQTDNQQLD